MQLWEAHRFCGSTLGSHQKWGCEPRHCDIYAKSLGTNDIKTGWVFRAHASQIASILSWKTVPLQGQQGLHFTQGTTESGLDGPEPKVWFRTSSGLALTSRQSKAFSCSILWVGGWRSGYATYCSPQKRSVLKQCCWFSLLKSLAGIHLKFPSDMLSLL